MQLCLAQEQELVFYTRTLVWFLLGRSFIVVYELYTVNYPLSEIEKGDIFFVSLAKKLREGPLFFGGGMRNIYKNCLQSLKRQNKLFANVIE